MGSKSSPKSDPVLDEINMMTLARLKREEEELAKTESQRQQQLATGRLGMSSLLSRGFNGFLGRVGGPGERKYRSGEKTVTPASKLREKQQKQAKRQYNREPTSTPRMIGSTPLSGYRTSMGITTDASGNIIRDNQG